MRRRRCRRRDLLLALLLSVPLAAERARADNAAIPDTPQQLGLRGAEGAGLQLQVFVNGFDSHEIVAFERDAAGRFLASRADLAAIGLKAGIGPAAGKVALDSLSGVAVRYDEAAQALYLTVPLAAMAAKSYSASPPRLAEVPVTSGWGAALNYDLYASTASWWFGQKLGPGAGSATLDARAFTPFGVLEQSGVLGETAFAQESALRLDTTFRYDDSGDTSYRAGDIVNSGLPWTRPVRLGGVQVNHGFGLRPDLVTGPSATVSGTAAVPSTADVYVNNFKIFSQPVDAGPFRIDNLPAIGATGAATIVLRDVTGKTQTESAPFFVASRLLRPGVVDYAAEAGFARLNYGVRSFDYDPHLVGSGSLRAGVTDWATVEGHAEGGRGLYNGGMGATFAVFQRGIVELSLAGSGQGRSLGAQVGLGGSTVIYGATFDASFLRVLKDYRDLAEVTAPPASTPSILADLARSGVSAPLFSSLLLSTSLAPPRELDRISVSAPRVFGDIGANLSFLNEIDGDGTKERVASVGLTHSFKSGLAVFATAFVDVANRRDFGAILGLSYTFGAGPTVSTQSTLQGGAFAQQSQVTKSAGQEVGDYGYDVDDQEGSNRYARANATYQSAYGRASVGVDQFGAGKASGSAASGEFAGSVAWLGGGFGFAPEIADSFAVVDAGAPGVTVLEDNRPIGKTDASGRLLAPGLRGFEDNKIALDPTTLPLDALAGETEVAVRPRAASGVFVDFHVRTGAHSAEVALVDEKGQPLPAGSQVEQPGGPSSVGYEGRAFLAELAAHNALTVHANGRTCVATFDFEALPARVQQSVGPVVCRAAGA